MKSLLNKQLKCFWRCNQVMNASVNKDVRLELFEDAPESAAKRECLEWHVGCHSVSEVTGSNLPFFSNLPTPGLACHFAPAHQAVSSKGWGDVSGTESHLLAVRGPG